MAKTKLNDIAAGRPSLFLKKTTRRAKAGHGDQLSVGSVLKPLTVTGLLPCLASLNARHDHINLASFLQCSLSSESTGSFHFLFHTPYTYKP